MIKLIPGLLMAIFLAQAPDLVGQPAVRNESLEEVLGEIENRFDVELEYENEVVQGLEAEGEAWREAEDAGESLLKVLAPHHLMFVMQGDSGYRIKTFETERRDPEEGKQQMEYLSRRYSDRASWEQRKQVLRDCMMGALKLSPLPSRPDSEPITTSTREMGGYTVENVAIETLPGVFVTGSLYRPAEIDGKIPVILSPNGHFDGGRYRADQQHRMATLAKMGAIVFSYDMFGWGESRLQFEEEAHRTPMAGTVQMLNGIRLLDYLTGLEEADPERVGMTGGSGGGSQTMLLTALDERIDVSVPVVMLSSYFNGGCPCESGRPIHLCGGGTNNAEIAAMAAPRPQLVVSDGNDWTADVPDIAFPYLQEIYSYYNKRSMVKNVHLPDEEHDYGYSKRVVMYKFMAENLDLDLDAVTGREGTIDESGTTIEEEPALYVFGEKGRGLPRHAVQGIGALEELFDSRSR